jgi:hypothetical protein
LALVFDGDDQFPNSSIGPHDRLRRGGDNCTLGTRIPGLDEGDIGIDPPLCACFAADSLQFRRWRGFTSPADRDHDASGDSEKRNQDQDRTSLHLGNILQSRTIPGD